MLKTKTILLIVGLSFASFGYAQRETTKNLAKFEHRFMHFGFLLGINSADLVVDRYAPPNHGADTLLSLTPVSSPGFNLGIISALHLSENFSLRFTPNIAFSQRSLVYKFNTLEGEKQYTKDIESTIINFPLGIKFKSDRVNNFSAYIICGASYGLDLASNEDAVNDSQEPNDIIVKLGKHDIMGEIGVGTDFYLQYFKFGLELKMSYGIDNIMIRENNAFSTPIENLRSKMFLLSLTFEG